MDATHTTQEQTMTTAPTLSVTKADTIKRIVERSIAAKVWRSECLKEALAYAQKHERKAVEAYVTDAYAEAGAGRSGRWQ